MPPQLGPFPNPVPALRELLRDLADCGTAAPDGQSWNGDPAFLRIRVYGGIDDNQTDHVRFDVDALTNDEQASDELAETVRQRILASPHVLTAAVIDNAVTDSRPHQVPWGANTDIYNATAAYSASFRRNRTP